MQGPGERDRFRIGEVPFLFFFAVLLLLDGGDLLLQGVEAGADGAHVGVILRVSAAESVVDGALLEQLRPRSPRPAGSEAPPLEEAPLEHGPAVPERAQVLAEGLLLELHLTEDAQVRVELLGEGTPVLLLVVSQRGLALLERLPGIGEVRLEEAERLLGHAVA